MAKISTEYGSNGPDTVKQVHKPKDQFFRQRNEGRSETKRAKRAKEVKFKEEIWPQPLLVKLFRGSIGHAAHSQWLVHLSNPKRKMTPSDQLEIFLAPSTTMYRVEIETTKKYLIIHDLKGEGL